MTVRLPPPLPECTGPCGRPMKRADWLARRGKCTDCMTVAEAMQSVHDRRQLARVAEAARRRTDDRIDALARKRLARQTAGAHPAAGGAR